MRVVDGDHPADPRCAHVVDGRDAEVLLGISAGVVAADDHSPVARGYYQPARLPRRLSTRMLQHLLDHRTNRADEGKAPNGSGTRRLVGSKRSLHDVSRLPQTSSEGVAVELSSALNIRVWSPLLPCVYVHSAP